MRVQTYILRDETVRTFALKAVRMAALGMQIRISKPTRTTEQNKLLHALVSDIADQLPWPKDTGELHDVEFWKRRLTLGWIKENKREAEVIVDLEGEEFGLLLPHTSDLTTEQCASLSEWVTMFGVTNGVQFKEPKRAPEPPPRESDR